MENVKHLLISAQKKFFLNYFYTLQLMNQS